MKARTKGIIACCIAQGCFGIFAAMLGLASRRVKHRDENIKLNVILFSCFRDIGAAIILLLAARTCEHKPLLAPTRSAEIWFYMVFGLMGIFGTQLCVILGMFYTNSSVMSMWQPAAPVFAFFAGIWFGTEHVPSIWTLPGRLKLFGLCITAASMVVLHLGTQKHQASSDMRNPIIGSLLLMGGSLLTGVSVVFQKFYVFNEEGAHKWWSPYPIHVVAWMYVTGTVAIIVSCILGYLFQVSALGFDQALSDQIPHEFVLPLVYAMFINSALNYWLLTFANKHLPSSVVTVFSPVQVPISLVLSTILKTGQVNSMELLGGALIVMGMLMVSSSQFLEKDQISQVPQEFQPIQTDQDDNAGDIELA